MAMPKETIIYVTRDIERALGMAPCAGYHIVSNRTAFGERLARLYPDFITLIESPKSEAAGTGDLMNDPATLEAFAKIQGAAGTKPYLLVFKNTARIEPIAHERGWTLVNPPAAVSEKIENKLSQIDWLGELGRHLPAHRIEFMKEVRWDGEPFIIQWAHGHTGGGTILIRSEEELSALKARFPDRRTRVSAYIEGVSFTINAVTTADKVLISSPSYQITGLQPFTDSPFATVGNDWGLAAQSLSPREKSAISKLADEIGVKMQKDGWRGLFGIDVMRETATGDSPNRPGGKIYLIEINARQPASTTYESHLQETERANGAVGMTTFEAHMGALLGQPLSGGIIPITEGAQVIQRVTKSVRTVTPETVGALELDGFTVIPYENTGENSDLVRIQSKVGLMRAHNEWNEAGEKILSSLKANA